MIGKLLIEAPQWLFDLGRELRTQDNEITAVPVFQVREKDFIPAHEDFDPDGWVQIYQDEPSPAHGFTDAGEPEPEEGCRVFPVWVRHKVVQSFLTRKAAERYLKENKHNMMDPEVYVSSGYRNHELIQLREWLMRLKESAQGVGGPVG